MNQRLCCLLALLLTAAPLAHAAESLAPPHAPIVEGLPVPVTAHPDQLTLLNSANPALAANKRLVFDYWRTVMLGGRSAEVEQFVAEDFVEHNPLLPSTSAALQAYVAANLTSSEVPALINDLVTLVAEGPYVVMTLVTHYPEAADASKTYTSTHFEMFRVNDGRIAEHWDSWLFRSNQVVPDYGDAKAQPVIGLKELAQYALVHHDDPALFVNKRLVFDLWRHLPEGGREELAELYMDPIYIQHNPNAATGREGVKVYFSRRPDTSIETWLEDELVAMVAEGDLVVQVLETEREQNGVTYQVPWFDMFRIENGLVIEHWDTASKGELPPIMQQGQPRPE